MSRAETVQVLIGTRLQKARLQAGLEVKEVARSLGVRHTAVVKWEAGLASPCLLHFRDLLPLYGVASHQVLFGQPLFELTDDQARELSTAAAAFSPALRAKALLIAVPTQ